MTPRINPRLRLLKIACRITRRLPQPLPGQVSPYLVCLLLKHLYARVLYLVIRQIRTSARVRALHLNTARIPRKQRTHKTMYRQKSALHGWDCVASSRSCGNAFVGPCVLLSPSRSSSLTNLHFPHAPAAPIQQLMPTSSLPEIDPLLGSMGRSRSRPHVASGTTRSLR